MIEISPVAKNKIQDCLGQNPGKFPRISFSEGGLLGPSLKLDFEEVHEGDKVEDVEGFHMLVAEDVSFYAQKMIVDYVQGRSFEIEAKEGMICNEDCASCQGCEV